MTLGVLAVTILAVGAQGASAAGLTPRPARAAAGGPPTSLTAAFAPKHLGQATTVTFAINIDPPAEAEPPPLREVDFSYPSNLGFATSGLGLASCDPVRLQAEGQQACPANSKMGSGQATVEVAFGADLIKEGVTLALFAGPSPDGYLHLVILAEGREPVEARIVITAVLLPGHLQITVPAIPGLPGASDVALTQIRASLGGPLTYYERARGRTIAYRPKGIGLPDACPRGGWRLGAKLVFRDGQHSRAGAAVPCPRQLRRRGH